MPTAGISMAVLEIDKQRLMSLRHLPEELCRFVLWSIRVLVRVVLEGELAVCLANIIGSGTRRQGQRLQMLKDPAGRRLPMPTLPFGLGLFLMFPTGRGLLWTSGRPHWS